MSQAVDQNTIKAQLDWAAGVLYQISCSSRLDAEVLLAHCLKRERSYLMTWPERELDATQQACYRELIRRRLRPEPVAYLVGHREFYSLDLITTPATLVPRPETEMLVDAVLDELESRPQAQVQARVLEMGTGTGAIAVAIKHHASNLHVTATDIDSDTLNVARSNAQKLGANVEFIQSDWYSALPVDARFNVIVSNPPYIAEHDPYLAQGDLPAEPRKALCSGPSGLEALKVIVSQASSHLIAGGLLVLEHGWDQGAAVAELMTQAGFANVKTERDFNDLARMTVGRWPS